MVRAMPLAAVLLLAAGCGTAPPAMSPPVPTPASSDSVAPVPSLSLPAPKTLVVPQGVHAGVAVFDRQSATFTVQVNAATRFRSASLVKLLIAMDYLWDRGPGYALSSEDQRQLEIMLRGSDDNAATYFWQRIGGEPAINRMISRLGLQDTKPPSAVGLKGWGSTTLSANDIVRVYQHLLDKSPAGLRDLMMGHLRQSTPCGTDQYHQTFGIPVAFGRPWTAKQGWWGFGDKPPIVCTAQTPPLSVPATAPVFKGAKPALMDGRVLHTSGTVGEGDRYIVAVLTQYPSGTSFPDAFAAITLLTRSLPGPPSAA
ncbi:serine hydrolase [Catelliglobosispora koreensis]|uniref:serine hydrolase n=1 Tax=Catelliglobosispora koreensis TaxID=129052 RepID=UPI000370E016|nr:serine hydrolase [Catelliglobosispora koreensis]